MGSLTLVQQPDSKKENFEFKPIKLLPKQVTFNHIHIMFFSTKGVLKNSWNYQECKYWNLWNPICDYTYFFMRDLHIFFFWPNENRRKWSNQSYFMIYLSIYLCSLSHSLCLCLSVSVCLSVCLCLSLFLSIYIYIYIYPSMSAVFYLYIHVHIPPILSFTCFCSPSLSLSW